MLEKEILKKDVKRMSWGLIWYMVLNFFVVVIVMSVQLIRFGLENTDILQQEQYIAGLENEGTSMIVGVFVGLLFLMLYMKKYVKKESILTEKRQMTPKKFWQILCIFMTAQFVFSLFASVLEAALNMIGYSAMESIEAASGGSVTISMFLYASFVAPVVEEIVYRGFVFRMLRNHGKMFAIVTSSILFGVMHANIPQMAFAMAVGFVLAYVTEEYSIKWAICLHMINNFVFAELLSLLGKFIGEEAGEILSGLVIFAFFLAGSVVLLKNRHQLKDYFAENKEDKKKYVYAFTVLPMILFVGVCLLLGIGMLQAL